MDNTNALNIIFEDKDILVVLKPQGQPCAPDKTGDPDLYTTAKQYLADGKNGYTALIHRLDRPVGGLMVLAKNEETAKTLSLAIANREFTKKYTAVVCGKVLEQRRLVDYMVKNERLNISKIVNKNVKGAKEAILTYKPLETAVDEQYGDLSLVEINLETGRHHQIRAQLSNSGIPLWGDMKYNDMVKVKGNFIYLALYATFLSFKHPKSGETVTYRCLPPNINPFNKFQI